jgi:hypothetical protein
MKSTSPPRCKQTVAWPTSCQHLYSTLSTRIFIASRSINAPLADQMSPAASKAPVLLWVESGTGASMARIPASCCGNLVPCHPTVFPRNSCRARGATLSAGSFSCPCAGCSAPVPELRCPLVTELLSKFEVEGGVVRFPSADFDPATRRTPQSAKPDVYLIRTSAQGSFSQRSGGRAFAKRRAGSRRRLRE